MNKRIMSAKNVRDHEAMFQCPLCGSDMRVSECKSLFCVNKHTFDFTRQGYLNLMTRPVKTKYGKELFVARRRLVETGFFEPLSQAIAEIINQSGKQAVSIIDMGCGEGSHLAKICDLVSNQTVVTGVGIDLAKEGILMAAKNYPNQIWAVADLANTPFKDQQFDVILNILSPSNYAEFQRLLKPDGWVVKVVPQSGYLKELRAAFFDGSEKESYSNEVTVERLKKNFQIIESSRLQYSVLLDHLSIQSLIQMTPLAWAATAEQISLFIEKGAAPITVDFEILTGKKFI